jgi:hypothetical protein
MTSRRQYLSQTSKSIDTVELLNIREKIKQKRIEEIKKERIAFELSQCSFKPKISKNAKSQRIHDVFTTLHN